MAIRKNADAVDMVLAQDILGDSIGVAANRNWLFDHGFNEYFVKEDGDYASKSWFGGFMRTVLLKDIGQSFFNVHVCFLDDGECEATIPLSEFGGKMMDNLRDSDEWYRVLSVVDKSKVNDRFRSMSAEEAVAMAVVAGREFLLDVKRKFKV